MIPAFAPPLDGGPGPVAAVALLRARLAWHPEWWSLALAGGSWGSLIVWVDAPSASGFCGLAPGAAGSALPLLIGLSHGVVMLAAMMLPLIVAPLRHAAFASLRRRRQRAVAGFLMGYLGFWLAAGLAAAAFVVLVGGPDLAGGGLDRSSPLLLAAAGLWELTAAKRRALSLCHRTMPLRPSGWRADVDCLRFGAMHARACIAACWLIMAGAGTAPTHLPAMAAVTVIAATQRYRPERHQRVEALCLALLAGALLAGLRS